MRRQLGLVLLGVMAACGGSCSSAPTSTQSAVTPTSARLATTTTFALDEEARELLDVIDGAVADLLDAAGTDITMLSVEGGDTVSTGASVVDLKVGSLQSQQVDIASRSEIVTDRIVLPGEMFVRIYPTSEGDRDWSRLDVDDSTASMFVAEAYTGFGALGASLERVLELARGVPVTVADRGEQSGDGVDARVIQLTFRADDIRSYLAENQLERVGPFTAPGSTVYEFWIDDSLVRLSGAGTQFFDGEAIEGVSTRVDYEILEKTQIQPPRG